MHSDEPNAPLFLRLFDSLLKPILLYGSEIWGVCKPLKKDKNGDFVTPNCSSNIKTIDNFVNQYYRNILGVPKNCSTVGIHRELGRLPIKINIFKSMIHYWFRLVTLPKDRLISHCYWSLFNNPDIHDDWMSSIKNIIQSSGLAYLWTDQSMLHSLEPCVISNLTTTMFKSLECQSLQNANSEINQQNKLHLFKNVDHSLKPAPYLSKIHGRSVRSLFSKLRLGTLPLEIETGRHIQIDSNKRFCKLCHSDKIGNEIHFLFDCPALDATRKPLLDKIISAFPRLQSLSTKEKTLSIFFNNQLDQPTLSLASTLLNELFSNRDKQLLSVNATPI